MKKDAESDDHQRESALFVQQDFQRGGVDDCAVEDDESHWQHCGGGDNADNLEQAAVAGFPLVAQKVRAVNKKSGDRAGRLNVKEQFAGIHRPDSAFIRRARGGPLRCGSRRRIRQSFPPRRRPSGGR